MDAALDYIEEKGTEKGVDKVNQLALFLAEDGRIEDFMRSAKDRAFQKQLFIEYGLENEK